MRLNLGYRSEVNDPLFDTNKLLIMHSLQISNVERYIGIIYENNQRYR